MKKFLLVPVLAALLGLLLTAADAPAEDSVYTAPVSKPLVTIRFNQRHLSFEKTLGSAVKKAQEAKPDVEFTVSHRPALQGGEDANLTRVTEALESFGVPQSRIHTRSEETSGRHYDEVLVYVR